MRSILLAPHNDDETLFAAYTQIREKPLVIVCTDSWIQGLRGTGITAVQRRLESMAATSILGCHIAFLGIRDHELTEDNLTHALTPFLHYERVYAPALQGGHDHHDIVSRVADKLFPMVKHYATYAKGQVFTPLGEAIVPTQQERELKNTALSCYESQVNYHATRPHFDAVKDQNEYLI